MEYILYTVMGALPAIGLLIFIFRMDRKEKEPAGMLISLFFIGVGITAPAVFFENLVTLPFHFEEQKISSGFLFASVEAFLCAALVEEALKYFGAYIRSWRSKNFNCTFDAIVYCVFVSLGFALIENVLYVVQNGFMTGILRALTSVPGHMAFAVFMGYFMGQARKAANEGRTGARVRNMIFSFVVPYAIHGVYDFLLFAGNTVCQIIWFIALIPMFIFSFRLIVISSKQDQFILANGAPTKTLIWTCMCGHVNQTKFCAQCGTPMPYHNVPPRRP